MTGHWSDIVVLAALAAALAVWTVLAGAEATLVEARTRKRHPVPEGGAVDPLFYELHRHPRRLLISLVLGRELALVAAAAVAGVLGYRYGGVRAGTAMLAAVLLVVVVLRGAAAGRASRRAAREDAGSGPVLVWLLAPLRGLAALEKGIGRRLAHAFLGTPPTGDNIFAAEEFAALSQEGEEELTGAERDLVANAIRFGERPVRQVLTPRRDIVAASVDSTPAELLRLIRESGCSRIPVYRDQADDLIGILYVKDLIGQTLERGGIETRLRQPYVVPIEKSVAELFREFRARKVHIALVVDEYGSLVGLVTMEDLLEELFGEIRDEFDEEEEPAIRRRGPRSYVVSGRASVSVVNDRLKLDLRATAGEGTIAGVFLDRLGRVPDAGERLELDGCVLTVEKLDGPAIELLRVDLWPSSSSP